MDQKPRQIAARILFEWDAGEGYAEILLKRHLTNARLSPPDRRLVQEMVYGVIRNAALLDAWIDIAARQPLESPEAGLSSAWASINWG